MSMKNTDKQTNLERWQAEHIAKYIWWVAHGLRNWQSDRTSYAAPAPQVAASIERPGYLIVRVSELPSLEIERHTLRFWRSRYAHHLDQTDPAIKEEWMMHLQKSRWTSPWYYHSRSKQMVMGPVDPRLANWTVQLARLAERLPELQKTP